MVSAYSEEELEMLHDANQQYYEQEVKVCNVVHDNFWYVGFVSKSAGRNRVRRKHWIELELVSTDGNRFCEFSKFKWDIWANELLLESNSHGVEELQDLVREFGRNK